MGLIYPKCNRNVWSVEEFGKDVLAVIQQKPTEFNLLLEKVLLKIRMGK
jgi:hypothetical protein